MKKNTGNSTDEVSQGKAGIHFGPFRILMAQQRARKQYVIQAHKPIMGSSLRPPNHSSNHGLKIDFYNFSADPVSQRI